MENHLNSELTINGVAKAGGGQYRRVSIDGIGYVSGDVLASNFRTNGKAIIRGNVEATESFYANGNLKIEGRLSSMKVEINGFADVQGSLAGDYANINGFLKIRGNCELERFVAEGSCEIRGLLNAGYIGLSLYGKARAREIGCETIRARKVTKSKWMEMLGRIIDKWAPRLEADIIEGDNVDLEHTVAPVVRGDRVMIGPGCRIGKVEYRTEFSKHPSAFVGEERKIDDRNYFA